MNQNSDIIISTRYIKAIIFFILKLVIIVAVLILVHQYIDMLPTLSPEGTKLSMADSMAVANTFMVFVTFIVVVATVGITVMGLYLSRWWSREKKQVLAENWSDMIDEVKKDTNLMNRLKEDLLSESLEEMMKSHIDLHKENVDKNIELKIIEAEKRIVAQIKIDINDKQSQNNTENITLT